MPPAGEPLRSGTMRQSTGGLAAAGGPRPSAGSDERPNLVGTQLGRYGIEKVLGAGGMGAVYLAHDTQLDRKVALKVPHFSAKSSAQLLERFQREARAAATLQHPNLCPVYDVGEIDGIHFLTMAFIEGRPAYGKLGRLPVGLSQAFLAELTHDLRGLIPAAAGQPARLRHRHYGRQGDQVGGQAFEALAPRGLRPVGRTGPGGPAL
jgi:Protein kinase domain